jgi:hypothetical protein
MAALTSTKSVVKEFGFSRSCLALLLPFELETPATDERAFALNRFLCGGPIAKKYQVRSMYTKSNNDLADPSHVISFPFLCDGLRRMSLQGSSNFGDAT